MRFHYFDNSASNLSFYLRRYGVSSGYNEFGAGTSAGAESFNRFVDVPINPALPVDNSQYVYLLQVDPGEATNLSRSCGAQVTYSVP